MSRILLWYSSWDRGTWSTNWGNSRCCYIYHTVRQGLVNGNKISKANWCWWLESACAGLGGVGWGRLGWPGVGWGRIILLDRRVLRWESPLAACTTPRDNLASGAFTNPAQLSRFARVCSRLDYSRYVTRGTRSYHIALPPRVIIHLPMLVGCWASVVDAGPASNQHW